MNEQQHSPEPWTEGAAIRPWTIEDAQGNRVIHGASPEDNRRIVACVNFLRGIPTEEIEEYVQSGCRLRIPGGSEPIFLDPN